MAQPRRMIRAFELAVGQLGDPRLRVVIWQSLALSLVLQVAHRRARLVGPAALAHFDIGWVNSLIRWLGGAAVMVLALMLFPASFGIVISIFMERIADIVEAGHYPQLGPARGIPIWTGIWTGRGVPGRGGGAQPGDAAVLHRGDLRRRAGRGAVLRHQRLADRTACTTSRWRCAGCSPAEVKAWRRANSGVLWLTGIVIVFLGTIPILNLIVPVLGTAAMVHVAQTLKPPSAPACPFVPRRRPLRSAA